MKMLKKYYKLIIIFVVLLIISFLGVLIYKKLFQENASDRLEGIENYELTKKEIELIKETLNELESVDSIDVYTNYKILKIFLVLSEDIDFKKVKEASNKALESISENNLSFYDVEIFVECENKESEIYPKIGYKYQTDVEFTWNR